jgi:hypothetical protein
MRESNMRKSKVGKRQGQRGGKVGERNNTGKARRR